MNICIAYKEGCEIKLFKHIPSGIYYLSNGNGMTVCYESFWKAAQAFHIVTDCDITDENILNKLGKI